MTSSKHLVLLWQQVTEHITPKIEDESSLWVLTGNVGCRLIEPNRPSLAECLDTPGVIMDRHISGDLQYSTICPTIRSPKGGGSNLKVIREDGTRRNVSGNELEQLMGWEKFSTTFGVTTDGEVISISEIQRHKMLGNGIIPAEIEDICNSLRPFLEGIKNNEVAIATRSLAPEVNNEVAIATRSLAPEVNSFMSQCEASDAVSRINNACGTIRELLVEIERRLGYKALGFDNMNQLLKSNLFNKAKSTLRLELVAGRIESENLKVPVGTFPESQLRNLAKLKNDYHAEAIERATYIAGSRPITASDITLAVAELTSSRPETRKQSIVDIIKEKTHIPYTETNAYANGDIVIINAGSNSTIRHLDGYWGIIERISSFAYHVCISVKSEVVLCKSDEMKRVELGKGDRTEIKSVSDRIAALQKSDLDDADDQFLDLLQRRTVWTQRQLLLLGRIEQDYGIC